MPDYTFERLARTPFSEVYAISTAAGEVGRVDLHFTPSGTVHATLCVPDGCSEDDVQELIAEIDENFVLSADPYRDDLLVTVWAGREAGVYSEDDEDDDESEGNGRLPSA